MDAAAQGRDQLQGLKTRIAANSEFSLCRSAFGQAVKNLWHRGIPTLLPRLSATSTNHRLVHRQRTTAKYVGENFESIFYQTYG